MCPGCRQRGGDGSRGYGECSILGPPGEYTATAVSAGGPNDRVSDLNNFWNAVGVRSPGDLFATRRGGALEEYDHLKTYYAGHGANYNTTTRLRRWNNGRLVFDHTDQEPYTSGHFAFRTVWSHFRVSDFRVWRLRPQRV